MSDLRNALQKGAANVINGHANQLRIQIEENDVLRAERDAMRAELAAVRKQHNANGKASRDRAEHIYKLRTKLNVAEAERDAMRELLREALAHLKTGQWAIPTDITLMPRIDAALARSQEGK